MKRVRSKDLKIIVDACSIIYLDKTTLAGTSVSKWLFKSFDVQLSSTVVKEIKRHLPLNSVENHCKKSSQDREYSKMETKYLQPLINNNCLDGKVVVIGNEKDKGERHSCCLGVESLLNLKTKQIIFLSDDKGAVQNIFTPLTKIMSMGSVWTSVDLLIYLHLTQEKLTYQHSADGIKDYFAIKAQAVSASGAESGKVAQQIGESIARLKLVDSLR